MTHLLSLLNATNGAAETTNYMIMGYTVIFTAMGLYLLSLIYRFRNLKLDLKTLEEISEEE